MVEILGEYELSQEPTPMILPSKAKVAKDPKNNPKYLGSRDRAEFLDNLRVSVRAVKSEDLALVFDSMVMALRGRPQSFIGWDSDDIRDHIHKTVAIALTTGHWTILIACNADDSDTIYGYLISDRNSNQVIAQYTKYFYRGLGIQTKYLMPFGLDPSKKTIFQFATKCSLEMQTKYPDKIKHRNFLSEYAWSKLMPNTLTKEQEP